MPDSTQAIGGGKIIQRRGIEQVDHEAADGEPAYTEWTCESRIMSESEYNLLESIADIDSASAVDAYTLQLIEEGIL